jgi:hypothetical protein
MRYIDGKHHVEYDRQLFEPDGKSVEIMQQHCGGENLIVYKGLVKPNGNQYC